MKQIYANLLGTWTNITDGGKIDGYSAIAYIKEQLQDLSKYDYINIEYNNKNYRIHPSLIQIVTE